MQPGAVKKKKGCDCHIALPVGPSLSSPVPVWSDRAVACRRLGLQRAASVWSSCTLDNIKSSSSSCFIRERATRAGGAAGAALPASAHVCVCVCVCVCAHCSCVTADEWGG